MNAALIVETRIIPDIANVIKAHLSKLPDDFELIIYHSNQNAFLFREFNCQKYNTVINSLRDYNYFMTNANLWKGLEQYDRVLIFQNDSMILREGIEEFYQYDYVGSPWKFQNKGGNGGLSLRNPKAMLRTIESIAYNPSLGYEDVYFCNHLIGNLAPRNICEKFGCETIFKLGTFGYHAIKNYLNHEQIEEIRNQYRWVSSK